MRCRGPLLAVVCFVLSPALLAAQVTLSVSGTVRDTSGAVLPGVSLTVTSAITGRPFTATTDSSGRYRLSGLTPGTYQVTVEVSGFSVVRRTIQLTMGLTATVDFTLDTAGPVHVEGGGESPPPPPPPPPSPPRYHVAVDGVRAGTANHVATGTAATARFWIAPTGVRAGEDLGNWAVNPTLLKERGRVPLTVFMTCTACATVMQDGPVTYNSDTRQSDEVHFTFTPARERADADGIGHLEFTVLKGGQLLDKVVATIVVESPRAGNDDAVLQRVMNGPADTGFDAVPGSTAQELQTLGHKTASVQTDPALDADFMFIFRNSSSGSGTDVEVAAVSDRARQILAPDTWTTFVASVDRSSIEADADQVYRTLKDLVTTRPDASALLQTLPIGLPWWDDAVPDKLSAADYQKALTGLGVSATLYNDLFNDSNQKLSDIVKRIENATTATDRPLRILIVTNGLMCPWTTLHAPGRNKAEDYWGFKYELAGPFLPGQGDVNTPARSGTLTVNYVAVPDDPDPASIGGMASQELSHLAAVSGVTVAPSRSRSDLLRVLQQDHASMRVMYAFIHGSDGTPIPPPPAGGTLVSAKLMFKLGDPAEVVTPFAIKTVKSQLGIGYGPLLLSHPVVVLNACDAGATGFSGMTSGGAAAGFPYTFLDLGASGVVAADAPLWALFAMRFGDALMTDVLKGTNLSTAVRNARLTELKRDNNPLGLLYSFYGPMNVRVP